MEHQKDIVIEGESTSGDELLARVRAIRPDVAVFDIRMPGMPGLNVIKHIQEEAPDTKIVIFTLQDQDAYVHKALTAGVLGYVLKTSPPEELVSAVRAAHGGTYYLCSKANLHVLRRAL